MVRGESQVNVSTAPLDYFNNEEVSPSIQNQQSESPENAGGEVQFTEKAQTIFNTDETEVKLSPTSGNKTKKTNLLGNRVKLALPTIKQKGKFIKKSKSSASIHVNSKPTLNRAQTDFISPLKHRLSLDKNMNNSVIRQKNFKNLTQLGRSIATQVSQSRPYDEMH